MPRVDEIAQRAEPTTLPSSLGGKETISLVEDDDDVRASALALLARSGCQVIVTRDGFEAVAAYERQPNAIDLVLTDVVMPGMGGRELAERLTARRADRKVLFMSGYVDDAILQHHVAAGGPLLQKPLSPEPVLRRIRAMLDARS